MAYCPYPRRLHSHWIRMANKSKSLSLLAATLHRQALSVSVELYGVMRMQ